MLMPPVSNVMPLPTRTSGFCSASPAGVCSRMMSLGFVGAAPADRQQDIHAQFLHFGAAQHVQLSPVSAAIAAARSAISAGTRTLGGSLT